MGWGYDDVDRVVRVTYNILYILTLLCVGFTRDKRFFEHQMTELFFFKIFLRFFTCSNKIILFPKVAYIYVIYCCRLLPEGLFFVYNMRLRWWWIRFRNTGNIYQGGRRSLYSRVYAFKKHFAKKKKTVLCKVRSSWGIIGIHVYIIDRLRTTVFK